MASASEQCSGSLCAKCPIPKQAQAHCWPETSPQTGQAFLKATKQLCPTLSAPGLKTEPPHSQHACPHLTPSWAKKSQHCSPPLSQMIPNLVMPCRETPGGAAEKQRCRQDRKTAAKMALQGGYRAKAPLQDEPRPRGSFRD